MHSMLRRTTNTHWRGSLRQRVLLPQLCRLHLVPQTLFHLLQRKTAIPNCRQLHLLHPTGKTRLLSTTTSIHLVLDRRVISLIRCYHPSYPHHPSQCHPASRSPLYRHSQLLYHPSRRMIALILLLVQALLLFLENREVCSGNPARPIPGRQDHQRCPHLRAEGWHTSIGSLSQRKSSWQAPSLRLVLQRRRFRTMMRV